MGSVSDVTYQGLRDSSKDRSNDEGNTANVDKDQGLNDKRYLETTGVISKLHHVTKRLPVRTINETNTTLVFNLMLI
jgi:hypothetical protein